MTKVDGLILVTGATGQQGGAVARERLSAGRRPRPPDRWGGPLFDGLSLKAPAGRPGG